VDIAAESDLIDGVASQEIDWPAFVASYGGSLNSSAITRDQKWKWKTEESVGREAE
jgi:hypothetical protein